MEADCLPDLISLPFLCIPGPDSVAECSWPYSQLLTVLPSHRSLPHREGANPALSHTHPTLSLQISLVSAFASNFPRAWSRSSGQLYLVSNERTPE